MSLIRISRFSSQASNNLHNVLTIRSALAVTMSGGKAIASMAVMLAMPKPPESILKSPCSWSSAKLANSSAIFSTASCVSDRSSVSISPPAVRIARVSSAPPPKHISITATRGGGVPEP